MLITSCSKTKDVNVFNSAGQTPLIEAIQNGDNKAVKKLIRVGADVNMNDYRGIAPLMYAVLYGNLEMVEVLIKTGATN